MSAGAGGEADTSPEQDAKQITLPVRLVETPLMLAQEALVSYEKRKEDEEQS